MDAFKLDDKVALVTGSVGGLGRAMAVALAQAGADVACHSRLAGGANGTCELVSRLGRKGASVFGDMSQRDAPRRIVDDVIDEFGRIDILVNNAGTIRRSPAVDYSEDDWSAVLEVNLSSIFRISQAAGRKIPATTPTRSPSARAFCSRSPASRLPP